MYKTSLLNKALALYENFRYKVLTGLLDSETDSNRPKVVILEDLPTFAYKRKDEFHDILIQYHKSSRQVTPIINNLYLKRTTAVGKTFKIK